jgi:dTDP-4-dehydrorhamnose 3,5-epimerase
MGPETTLGQVTACSRLVAGGELADVRLSPLAQHGDGRGTFTEVYDVGWNIGIDPTQWSLVRSAEGALRGMHLHRRHDEYVHVIAGTMTVGLFDVRAGSPTVNQSATYQLEGSHPAILLFPPGLVHGWLSHTTSIHLQAVSESYSSYGADDNDGCRWDDPELGIEWPSTPVLLSERAKSFPSLAVLRSASAIRWRGSS